MTADRSTEPLSTFQFSVKSNCLTYSKHDKFKLVVVVRDTRPVQSGPAKKRCTKDTKVRPFTCPDCGQKFTRTDHLKRHLKQQHSATKGQNDRVENTNATTTTTTTTIPTTNTPADSSDIESISFYSAPDSCDESTTAAAAAPTATADSSEVETVSWCSATDNISATTAEKTVDSCITPLSDPVVTASLSQPPVTKHSGWDTKVRPFTCPDCGQMFVRSEHLKRHLEELHYATKGQNDCFNNATTTTTAASIAITTVATNTTTATADSFEVESISWCSATDNISAMTAEKTVDSGITSLSHPVITTNISQASDSQAKGGYSCFVCGRTFAGADWLNSHLGTHAKRQPRLYKCDVCQRSFTRMEHCRRHSAIHLATRPRPHICTICGNGFTRKEHLQRHLRSHGLDGTVDKT